MEKENNVAELVETAEKEAVQPAGFEQKKRRKTVRGLIEN
jgi:hypothetical protein